MTIPRKRIIFALPVTAAALLSLWLGCSDKDDSANDGNTPQVRTYTLTTAWMPQNGGTVTITPDLTAYPAGDTVTVTATAADGYEFGGWSGSATTAAPVVTLVMNGNKTLATYFYPTGNPPPGTAKPDTTLPATPTDTAQTATPTDTTKAPTDTAQTVTSPAGTYTITVNINPNADAGRVTLDPDQKFYAAGTKVSAKAAAADKYKFVKWSGSSTAASASITLTMNADKEITANFEEKTYTLSAAAAPANGGTVTLNPNLAVYPAGTKVTATATPSQYYTFTKWSGATTSTSDTATITMDGNRTLTANFKMDGHTIAIEVIPPEGGTVTRTPDLEVYPTGTEEVILTATPSQHYKFEEWSGTGTGSASNRKKQTISVTTVNNRNLTCTFTPIEYKLTTNLKFNTSGGTVSRSPNNATYHAGDKVTVTAAPDPGFYFAGWSEDITSANPTVTITMDSHKTLTALFLSNHLEMVFVKGGTFTMGCTPEQGSDCDSNEKPAHQVTVSDFYIGKYEVSQKIWTELMGTNPSRFKEPSASYTLVGDRLVRTELPVEWVSYEQALKFIDRLNWRTEKNFRLPTEAEWEYAARGGINSKGYKFAGSNNFDDVGWYGQNSSIEIKTYHIEAYAPNELGIYNMSGNVCEWVRDELKPYTAAAQTNPFNYTSSMSNTAHILRGGSWTRIAKESRNSYRYQDHESDTRIDSGLRLVLPVDP